MRTIRDRQALPRRCLAHMERDPGRLQLRLVLYPGEHVCDIEIEENDEDVIAFASVCSPLDDDEDGEAWEVPCHVYLERPLGDRAVRDGHFGHEIPYRNIYAELNAEFGLKSEP
jgi:hypothetical protein